MKHRLVKLALVLTLGLALGASGNAFAVNAGGGGTAPPGGGCSEAGDKSGCYDGCAFAYYEFTDSSHTATVAGISVNNCTEYKGFWFNHYKRTYGGALFGARTIGNCLSSNGGQMYEIGGNPGTGIEATVYISGARFAGGILSDVSSAKSKYQEYYNDNPSGMSPDSFFSSGYNYFCYDPAPAVVENNATFSGSVSFSAPYGVSSLGGNSYRAASANTSYSFTPSYTVRRTDRNNPPSSARTQYAIGAYNYDNSISGWSTLTGFAPGGSQSFSGNSVSLSADWDSSSSACRYLSVADSRYRNDDFQSYTSYHAADYDCVTLYGPQSMRADFEGRIVISSDYGTVVNGDNNNTNASFTGTGFKTKYTFQVSYQLKRNTTSNDYPYAVPTNFDYSTSSYPSPTFSRSTSSMSAGNGYTAANSYVQPLTVTIEIGGADERACFYLSYDNQLTYRSGSTPYSTSHDGRVYKCLTIKNPKQAAELSYSATTVGSVDNHTDLIITNNGHNGELINQVLNSEGVYVDNFPAPKDYGVTFVHTLTRTDDPALTPTDDNDKRIAECANTTWRIYKQENGGAWTDTGKTRTECIKTKNGTVSITNKSSFEFTKNNMGTVVTYCEKLVYNNKISYEAHGHSVFDYGLTTSATAAETTPVCVRIANPAVEISTLGDHVHKILVTPTIDGTSVTGASGSSPNYSATALNVALTYNHTIARNDTSAGNYIEPSRLCATGQPASVSNPCFSKVNGSMYNNTFFDVSSIFSTRRTIDSTSSTTQGQSFTFGAYRSGDTDTSDSFNTTTTATIGAAELRAGETKTVCETGVTNRAAWNVNYEDVGRRKVYSRGDTSAQDELNNSTPAYSYTQLVSRAAEVTTPETAESSPFCVNITRDWNFRITEVTPPALPEKDQISSANQKFDISFDITIDRDDTGKDYVTDPDVTIIPITYVIEPGADVDTQINPAVNGGEVDSTDYCGFFSGHLGDKVSHCRTDQGGQLNGGSGNGVYGPSGSSYERSYSYDLTGATVPSDLDVGAKFCVAIAIRPLSSSTRGSGTSFISRSTCTNVSKRPAVHIWGGNVQTNGNVATSLNQIQSADGSSTETYGSWAEFALIARGKVKSMASGAGIVGGLKTSGSGRSVLCQTSALTIANNQCRSNSATTELGRSNVVNTSSVLTELKERYVNPSDDEASSSDVKLLQPDNQIVNTDLFRNERFTDGVGNIISNKIIVIYSSRDLTIQDDVSYAPKITFNSNVVPQILIIAEGDINLYGNVSRIDAWLVAGGTIDTCAMDNGKKILTEKPVGYDLAADEDLLSSSTCTNQLQLNGPVIASKINFKRTANGERDTVADPAEIVNHSAFSLIFGTGEMTRTGEPQVTYIKTLAPRY